ncbi:MAG: hypothetical protein ACI9OJ_005659, partial [Myxococcota bacterium]
MPTEGPPEVPSRPPELKRAEAFRAAVGGVPNVVKLGGPRLRTAFEQVYIEGELPLRLIDGVLLYLGLASRRRYPAFLHGALLLRRGDALDGIDRWLNIQGFDNPATLVAQWERHPPISTV